MRLWSESKREPWASGVEAVVNEAEKACLFVAPLTPATHRPGLALLRVKCPV